MVVVTRTTTSSPWSKPPLSTMNRAMSSTPSPLFRLVKMNGCVVVHLVDRREVHRRALANRGVRAAPGLDAHDALRGERSRAGQDQLVFLRVDVVRDRVDVVD